MMKIRMLETILPDLLFLAKPGTILYAGNEYEASANRNGAISGLCPNGEYLGVRPGEFVFVSVPNQIRTIWAREYPLALDGAIDEDSKPLMWSDLEQMDGEPYESSRRNLSGLDGC